VSYNPERHCLALGLPDIASKGIAGQNPWHKPDMLDAIACNYKLSILNYCSNAGTV
jgi:hypothetical protein